jgi:dienelactone hydrolase
LVEAKKLIQTKNQNALLNDLYGGWATLSAKTFVNLFDEDSNCHIFYYPTMNDVENCVLESIKIPVLAFTGTEDYGVITSSNPHIAMEKLEKSLNNSPRARTKIFEGADHDFKGFDEQIVTEVLYFINS